MRKFRGQTLVEYGLIVALVSIAVIVVAVSIVLCIYRRTEGIDSRSIQEIKG